MFREDHPYMLWIEAEEWVPGSWTPDDTNSDVIITREDGSVDQEEHWLE